MNKKEKTDFEKYVKSNSQRIKTSSFLKMGENRGADAKEGNYREVQDYLRECNRDINTNEGAVKEAVKIIMAVLSRHLEIQKPPNDNSASRKLEALKRDSTTVILDQSGVSVRLDVDQLKHQHPTKPIGTRFKTGGNRFKQSCDKVWHMSHTMPYMSDWAIKLSGMKLGDQEYHGQVRPVNGIHYEGFCLLADKKYVLFHCYPANDSNLKL